MEENKQEWLTVAEVAAEFNVSRNTVYGWIEPEDKTKTPLVAYRPGGGVWKVRRADLDAFIAAGRNVPTQAPEVVTHDNLDIY